MLKLAKRRIAILTASFCVIAAALLWATSRESLPERLPAERTPGSTTLDLSDPVVRRHVLAHRDGLVRSNLSPLADVCDKTSESYRGFLAESFRENVLVSIEVRGRRFEAIEYLPTWQQPAAEPRGSHLSAKWMPRRRTTGETDELAPLRSMLDGILDSGEPVVFDDGVMDGTSLTVEACRHGRYHFFERYPSVDADALSEFMRRLRMLVRPAASG